MRKSQLRSLVVLVSALGLLPGGSGCVAVIPYQPDEGLVGKAGFPEVKKRLSEMLGRVTTPHVTAVDVTEDSFRYEWSETYLGPFYNPVTASHQGQVFYGNIARIEVYENNNVFVWGPGDQRVDKFLFGSAEDAKGFADLVMSLRAWRKSK